MISFRSAPSDTVLQSFRNCDNVPNTDDIIKLIKKAINIYTKPREILTDHGARFYANTGGDVSSFNHGWMEKRPNTSLPEFEYQLPLVRMKDGIGQRGRMSRNALMKTLMKRGLFFGVKTMNCTKSLVFPVITK
ncbi:MAG: hypothetical protein DRN57_08910 [Thermoplasmata archaeon]|nr:MAG: hypothetical protein DRN57_08910 [Thermoplasmata archaeon]